MLTLKEFIMNNQQGDVSATYKKGKINSRNLGGYNRVTIVLFPECSDSKKHVFDIWEITTKGHNGEYGIYSHTSMQGGIIEQMLFNLKERFLSPNPVLWDDIEQFFKEVIEYLN